MTLNPLSNPKGIKQQCELCGKVAYLQCQFCKVTYYCSKEHQTTDWNGIHVKICQQLIPLRTPSRVLGSEEERKRRDKTMRSNQLALLELAKTEGQKHLHEGKYELAIPAALQSLRVSIELYGAASIELVPSYLLLGEASIGLERFGQAEEYLSLAKYSVLKKPDCPYSIRSQLHRNFGKLYASQHKYDEALHQLANDVYYSSLEYGPEDVSTTGGYFHMGNVFVALKEYNKALAMYEKVSEIWYKYLFDAIRTLEHTNVEIIDEAATAECLQMLLKIKEVREGQLGDIHRSTGESYHVLGLLHRYMRNYEYAQQYTEQALSIYAACDGDDAPSTLKVKESLQFFDMMKLRA